MDIFDDSTAAPIYLVTDFNQSYDGHGNATDSDTIISEASSGQSMTTIGSEEVATYFRSVHGFQFITDENVPMVFTTESHGEINDIIYNSIIKLLQGDRCVPNTVDQFLRLEGIGGTKITRVLDLVTMSGAWVQEMANTYTMTEFVSLDVKPLAAFVPHPRIVFEVYDLYAGIAEPDASFDLVHMRMCMASTKDFNLLLREVHRVLKPGGMILIGETQTQAFEADNPSVVLHSSPRRVEAVQFIRRAKLRQGIDLAAFDEMSSRLDPGHPMWNNHHRDDKDAESTVRGFHTIMSRTHVIPSGSWPTDERQKLIGSLARMMFENTWKALLPMMQIMGYDEASAKDFVDKLMEEVKDPRYRSCAKYKAWCARRI